MKLLHAGWKGSARLLAVVLVMLSCNMQAQDFLGYSSSNYAGLHALYSNPGEIVDNRYRFDINLLSFTTTFDNDFLEVTNPLGNGLQNNSYADFDDFRDQELTVNFDGANQGQTVSLLANLEAMGPGILFQITPTDAIGLSSRLRLFANIDDVSAEAARLALDGFEFP